MCDPASALALSSLAVGVASSAYSYSQSNNQANQAASLANRNAELERNQQIEAYNAQQAQQRVELDRQAQDAAVQWERTSAQREAQYGAEDAQYRQLDKQTQAASSTAAVRAAEGGAGGLSVQSLMSDYIRQEMDSRLALDTERNSVALGGSNNFADYSTGQQRAYQDYNTNAATQARGINYGLQSGNYSLQNNLLRINDSRQTLATTGLNMASSAVSSGAMYYSMKQPTVAPNRLNSYSAAKTSTPKASL